MARPAALISPDFSWLASSTENATTLPYLRRSNKVHGTVVAPSLPPSTHPSVQKEENGRFYFAALAESRRTRLPLEKKGRDVDGSLFVVARTCTPFDFLP